MSRSMFLRALCVVAVLCLCSTLAQATLINIDLNCTDGDGALVGTYAGTAPGGGGIWNGYAAGSTVANDPAQSGFLLDSTGTATTVKIDASLSQSGGWTGFSPNALMADYFGIGGDNGLVQGSTTFTFTGLTPNATYKVYAYNALGASMYGTYPATFTFGGTVKTPTGTGFDGTFIEDVNYALFSSVVADGNGTITGTVTNPGTAYNGGVLASAIVNGFQIQDVPEPSTIALLASVLLGLLCYAWRRRK